MVRLKGWHAASILLFTVLGWAAGAWSHVLIDLGAPTLTCRGRGPTIVLYQYNR